MTPQSKPLNERIDEWIPAKAHKVLAAVTKVFPGDALVLAIAVVVFCLLYAWSWYTVMRFSSAIEYEGPMFWAANALAHGQNIYDLARLTSPPWHVITYPPLFIGMAALLVKIFGPAFWCLRAVTIAAAIASVFLLYRLLRLSGCAPIVAAIAPAYFIGFSPTFVWNNCGRPDSVATAFCLAGLERLYSAFLQVEAGKKWLPSAVMAGVLLALSCMSKQTSIVCTVSGLIFLVWCKRLPLAAIVAAVMAGSLVLMGGLAQLITGGFIQNMVYFGKVHWHYDLMTAHLHFMSDGDVLRCEILLAVLIYCIVGRKQTTSVPERLPYVLFGLAFLNMMYMLGLPDSNGNHAIFCLLALSWWLAWKCSTLPTIAARIVLLTSLVGVPFLFQYFPGTIAQLPQDPKVLQQVDLTDKLVLAEDPSLNLLSRSQPAMVDCAVFEAVWSACEPERVKAFEQSIARRQFAALIVNCSDLDGTALMLWPPSTVKVMKDQYKSAGKLSGNGVCEQLMLPR